MHPDELLAVSRTLGEPRSFADYLRAARGSIRRLLSDDVFWVSSHGGTHVPTVVRATGTSVDHPLHPALGRHQLSLVVEASGPTSHAWIVARDAPDFSDVEVDTAAWLLPVLTAYHRAYTNHAPERLEQPLTSRETDVLSLVAHGLTATAIGHRLGISARTVSKHLEHAYAKLGEHDRLLATQRALSLGILTPAREYVQPRMGRPRRGRKPDGREPGGGGT
jgi:DNA-binding CsgD family transcriptional regulator